MEANGCIQQLDLAEIFTMSMLKVKNDVKMVNLFTQALSTCLPWPSQPVYPGLVYLFAQAWIFSRYGDTLENIDFAWISSFKGVPGLGTITVRSALKS